MNTVAFDTETKGFDWWDPTQQVFLITWTTRMGDGWESKFADVRDPVGVEQFKEALLSADQIVAHNLSFDAHQVRESIGFDIRQIEGVEFHDTDLLSRVVESNERTHGLKPAAERLVDPNAGRWEEQIEARMKELKIPKSKQGAYYEVYRAYPDDMCAYAMYDALYTAQLFDIYMSRMTPALRKVYDLEMRVEPILANAERVGIRIDQDAVQDLRDTYEPQEEVLRERLMNTLGDVLEGEGSRDGLIEALEVQGVPLHRRTEKTGVLRTDKFALAEFEDDFPVIQDLQEYRRVSRFLDTYLEPMSKANPDLHTSFSQCEAWTGRMSSRRPNLQNLPKAAGKEVRRPLVARPGHEFLVFDYEGIEARLLAYYLGDQGYRALITEGRDPHAWMAANIHGGSYLDYLKPNPLRDKAKNTMFAITYGAGAPRVADMNKIPKDEAKALISTIKGSLPGYYTLMKRIKQKVKTHGYVETIAGRKQYINQDKAYVGLNALIQGSAADIMKEGLVRVENCLPPSAQVLLVVHDEIVVECPTELSEWVEEDVATAMTTLPWDIDPPLTVDNCRARSYEDA